LHRHVPLMRRRTLIAAAWIVGTTVPLLLAAVFLVGCCVLPFHAFFHKLAPICQTAVAMIAGDHHGGGHGEQPAVPARQKEEPVKRIFTETTETFRLSAQSTPQLAAATAATGYRSFITLGAARCDQDVGLYVLVDSFLI
jgi:hypothetical protein